MLLTDIEHSGCDHLKMMQPCCLKIWFLQRRPCLGHSIANVFIDKGLKKGTNNKHQRSCLCCSPGKKHDYFHPHGHGPKTSMKKLCEGGPEAIMGTLIVLWKMARCPLVRPFSPRKEMKRLSSQTH